MIFIGIDPGAKGGVAWIEERLGLDGEILTTQCFPLPETERDIFGLIWKVGILKLSDKMLCMCLIEKVHSMPKQGVASSFKFGRNYGFLRGLLVALELCFDEVTPQRWQKAMGCLSHGDKNVTKQKAQQLFPTMKITHSTADALLIAEYCRRTHSNDPLSC